MQRTINNIRGFFCIWSDDPDPTALFCIIALFVGITIPMCSSSATTDEEPFPQKFILVDYDHIKGYGYRIMEYEGHRYFIVSDTGGVTHLESCQCKNK